MISIFLFTGFVFVGLILIFVSIKNFYILQKRNRSPLKPTYGNGVTKEDVDYYQYESI